MTPAAARPVPVAAGYVVVPDGLDDGDAPRLVRHWGAALGGHAAREGYALGAVFTDVAGRGEPGLYDLVGHVRRGRAAAVVVPDLPTLTRSACLAGADRLTAARFLRAPVLTIDPTATDPPGPAPGPGPDPALPAGGPGAETAGLAPLASSGAWPGRAGRADGAGTAPVGRHTRAPAAPRLWRTDREEWWQ